MSKRTAAVKVSLLLSLLAPLALASCRQEQPKRTIDSRAGDVERGKRIYLANCVACHHSDPARNGPIGPAIQGSSRALIEARVITGTYPPGYTPKRQTKAMPPMPYLKSAVPDLAAFLNGSAEKTQPDGPG
jgi:mono/diheme cytochrome c family protein